MNTCIQNSKAKGYAICFAAVLILSMDSLFIRHVALVEFFTFLFYRHLFASVAFGLILICGSGFGAFQRLVSPKWKTLIAVVHVCVFSLAFSMSLRYGIIAVSLVIISSSPIFSAIISYIFIGEVVERSTIACSLACFAAIVYVFVSTLDESTSTAVNLTAGNICAVLCALFTGSYFSFLRYLVVVDKESPDVEVIMTFGFLLTSLVSVAAGAGLEPINGMDSLFLILQGFICLTTGFYGLSIATELLSSTNVSLCMLLETILGPVIVFLGGYDAIPMPAVYGGIVIIVSLAYDSISSSMSNDEAKDKEIVDQEMDIELDLSPSISDKVVTADLSSDLDTSSPVVLETKLDDDDAHL